MAKRKGIMLLITYKCNLRCSYCYEPKEKGFKMTAEKAKQIISEQLEQFNPQQPVEIQFMGGEPLLEFPLIKEVSEWLWNDGFDKGDNMLFAPTNGTLLTDEMKEWFTANKNRITLGLSFDGDMTMQNINRSNSFEKVDLKYFVETWPEQSVKMTIAPSSVSHLSEGVRFLHSVGFKYISADLAMGPALQWGREELTAYKRELDKLSEYYAEHPDMIPFSMLRMDIKKAIIPAAQQRAKTCDCGENLVCIDWTGHKYACHLFSPVSLPADKAKKSNELYDFHNHEQFYSQACAKCALYNLCPHCYGMNYLCSGDVTKPSPSLCRAFRLQFVANCQFQQRIATKNNDTKHIESINHIISKLK